MEFSFDVRGVLPDTITRVSRHQLPRLGASQRREDRSQQQLAAVVNKLGAASAKAQGLRVAVTTYQKLMASSHTLYLLRDEGDVPVVVGLLKVGGKKLFLQDPLGTQREMEPLCVLDFYIHETRQRAGHGWRLFQNMLETEGVRAAELAIDRPSSKFLSFLRKHYSLHSDVKQGNNFVVFTQFFQNANSLSRPVSKLTSCTLGSGGQQKIETRSSSQPAAEEKPPLTSAVTPEKNQLPRQHQTLSAHPGHEDDNFNWSPDSVLLRSRQRLRATPCDIITGAPLPPRERPPLLLTMRERERCLKGGSRLGFGGPFARHSLTATTPLGCHLVGDSLASRGGNRDSAYSRHSLNPIQPSSHALIQTERNPDPNSSSRFKSP